MSIEKVESSPILQVHSVSDSVSEETLKTESKVRKVALAIFTLGLYFVLIAVYNWAKTAWTDFSIKRKVHNLQNSGIKPPEDFVEENYRLSLTLKTRESQNKEAERREIEDQFLRDLHRISLSVDGQKALVGDDLVLANGEKIRIRGRAEELIVPVTESQREDRKKIFDEFQKRFKLDASSDEWLRLLALLQQGIAKDSYEELMKKFVGDLLKVTSDESKYTVLDKDYTYGFTTPEEDRLHCNFSIIDQAITASRSHFICDGSSKKPLALVRHTTVINLKDPTKNAYSFELRPLVKGQPKVSA